jgi:hypothetical protein
MEKFHKPNLISTTSTWEKFPNVLGEHLTVCFRVILFNNKLRIFLEGYIFWGQNLPIRRPHNFFLKQTIKIKMKIPVNSKFPKIITQTIHKLNSQRKLRLSRSLCTRVGIRASLHTRIRDRMHTCQIRASWHKRLGFGDKLFASA